MKILVVRGYPRRSGITNKFAEAFLRGAKQYADVIDVDLCAKKISPCNGCYACVSSGRCVIKDDMDFLLEQLKQCDVLTCFTPLYFYSMSAQLKTFFDRCFPIVAKRELMSGSLDTSEKKLFAFTVASGRLSAFEAVSKNFEMISSDLNFELIANIRRGEGVYFSGVGEDSIRVKKILKATERAGEEVALNGCVASETIQTIELMLAPSDEEFKKRARVYWQLITK